MKKSSLIILILLLLLVGCTRLLAEKPLKEGEFMDRIVDVKTGVYHYKDWTDSVGTYTDPLIPDSETAVLIGDAILSAIQGTGLAKDFVLQQVFFDEVDEVWILSYWEERDVYVDGNDCNIAIRKSNAEVLRVWFGE